MAKKEYGLVIGQRGSSSNDPLTEIVRRRIADTEQKKQERQDEVDDLEHKAKVDELKSKGKEPAAITFKPVEIDVNEGKKSAEERAQRAEVEVATERDKRLETQEKLEQERMANLRSDFTKQLDDLKKLLEGGVGSKQSITEKIAEVKSNAEELGYGPKQAGGIPADVQIQLQDSEHKFQLEIERLKDDRERRSEEMKLAFMKYGDDKEFKKQELQQEANANAERTQLMRDGLATIGRVAGKAMVEGGGGGVAQKTTARQYPLTADEGETGEFDCPGCGSKLYLAPDAMIVSCPGCGSISSFTRTKAEAPHEEAKVEGEEIAHPV